MAVTRHFNPLFPYGKRPGTTVDGLRDVRFQSTLPIREETYYYVDYACMAEFQSTLPIREETAYGVGKSTGEGFQSTLPIREETFWALSLVQMEEISIHSSHTGRDHLVARNPMDGVISIHSSHTGRDFAPGQPAQWCGHFNPLFPYGKRPCNSVGPPPRHDISIHSSHTGRDTPPVVGAWRSADFNPLFPYGKRPDLAVHHMLDNIFQSTLPIREETHGACKSRP